MTCDIALDSGAYSISTGKASDQHLDIYAYEDYLTREVSVRTLPLDGELRFRL